jgi:hypothetical protein
MAKAQLVLASGTKVTLEGSEDEIAKLVMRLDGKESPSPKIAVEKKNRGTASKSKSTVSDLINGLLSDGLLKHPTDLATIKRALEQQGHYYPNPTIATALLRLVKKRQLRRVKQEGQWRYVG